MTDEDAKAIAAAIGAAVRATLDKLQFALPEDKRAQLMVIEPIARQAALDTLTRYIHPR